VRKFEKNGKIYSICKFEELSRLILFWYSGR